MRSDRGHEGKTQAQLQAGFAQARGPAPATAATAGGHRVLEAMLQHDASGAELDATNPEMLAEFDAAWQMMKEGLQPAERPQSGLQRTYVPRP